MRRAWYLALPWLVACGGATNPPAGVYPPDGRYFLEFSVRGDDGQMACSGAVAVDVAREGNRVSGNYGVTGPGSFGCGSGERHVIGNGTGTLAGFEFNLAGPAWHVEATASGPGSFLGTFRFVLPAAGGDSVVVGTTSGLRARG